MHDPMCCGWSTASWRAAWACSATNTTCWFPGDDLLAAIRPRGLPIGNLTSQFWANCYLNPFDHFVKRELRCQGYLRYVDDLLLFADDKATLWAWRRRLVERLARLRLTIHPGAHPRPVTEGIPFLGFVVYPDHRRLKRRKAIHYRRRFRGLVARYEAGEVPLERVTASAQGWANHARYGNTVGLRKAVLGSVVIPGQIECEVNHWTLTWKSGKKPRTANCNPSAIGCSGRRHKTRPTCSTARLCGLSLWPLVEAAQVGQFLPAMMALGGVAGGVGGELIGRAGAALERPGRRGRRGRRRASGRNRPRQP